MGRIHFGLLALLLAIAVSCPRPSHALDDKLSGEHLKSLLPEDVAGYTLKEIDAKENSPNVRGIYQSDTDDAKVTLAIAYGKDAAERYRKSLGKISLAASEGKMDAGEVSVQGRSVTTAKMGSRFIAVAFFNHFLVGVNAKGLDDPETAVGDFLEKVNLNRFAEWSPPDDLEYTVDESGVDAPDCFDMDCFSEHVARCEEAQLIGALGRRITVRYAVEGTTGADQCRLSFMFTDNPNAEWEDTPMYFTVDSGDDFTMEDVKALMEDCVEGEGNAYKCEGPLLELMNDE